MASAERQGGSDTCPCTLHEAERPLRAFSPDPAESAASNTLTKSQGFSRDEILNFQRVTRSRGDLGGVWCHEIPRGGGSSS